MSDESGPNAPPTDPVADPDADVRVVLLSSRPMFRRTFAKVLRALRPGLSIADADSFESIGARRAGAADRADGTRAVLVLLDAGGADATALADDVRTIARAPGRARVVVVLDEPDDARTDAAMAAGAGGVMIKTAPPGVLAEWLDALLDGETVRPAPSVPLGPEALSEALRARLSARRQKLLRLQMGGTSVTDTARALGMTPDKVVTEMRAVMDIVRGRDAGENP